MEQQTFPLAFFAFVDSSTREANREFIFFLHDPSTISHARALLAGTTKDNKLIIGKVVKSFAPYNSNWSFHLDPATTHFTQKTMEVADATVMDVEKHLGEVGGSILPNNFWSPWSANLTREITYRELDSTTLRFSFAFFAFVDRSTINPNREFTILVTNVSAISHAREILAGTTQDNKLISGKIVKSPAPYNANWSFYLDPATIKFLAAGPELANLSTLYVEKHLNAVGTSILPNNFWAPRGAKLTREIPYRDILEQKLTFFKSSL